MFYELPPFDPDTGHVHVIVETPKGHRNKYSYDRKRGLFRLKSIVPAGHVFPFDFGFIPGTKGEDGDPLDILVLMEEPGSQGCLVLVRLIALIEANQTENGKTERNDRLIGVAAPSHDYKSVQSLDQLSSSLLDEIEHFCVSYEQMLGRKFEPLSRKGAAQGREMIQRGMKAAQT